VVSWGEGKKRGGNSATEANKRAKKGLHPATARKPSDFVRNLREGSSAKKQALCAEKGRESEARGCLQAGKK